MDADLVVLNARVHTMNPDQPRASSLAVSKGRIIWAGESHQAPAFKRLGSRTLDLAGKTVLPGFIDAHQHQLYMGLSYDQVNARPGVVESIDDIVSRIRLQAERLPAGSWVEGFGYHDARLREGRHPNRFDLDRAAPDQPVLLSRTCGHVLAVNSRALELAGIDRDSPDPAGGTIDRDEATGVPTGILRESAMALVRRVLPRPEGPRLRKAILAASRTNLSHGITTVWEPSIEPDHLRSYLDLEESRELPLRVTMAHKKVLRSGEEVPLPRPFRRERLSLVAIKLFQDGGFGAATAALSEPYANAPESRGQLIWEQEELNQRAAEICRGGLRISVHAIGDAAIRSALEAIDFAGRHSQVGVPHRIEHCGLPLPPLPSELARRNLVPVLQPVFLWFDGDVYLDRLGSTRGRWLYPARTLLDCGLDVAGSSDGPVVEDVNPLLGISVAVSRRSRTGKPVGPEEAVSLPEAVELFTTRAARACGEGSDRGSLEASKAADFIVLAADPFEVSPEELPHIPIERVFLAGEEVPIY